MQNHPHNIDIIDYTTLLPFPVHNFTGSIKLYTDKIIYFIISMVDIDIW